MKRKIQNNEQVHVGGSLVITNYKDGKPTFVSAPMPNKVVTSSGYGRNLIARQLANDATYPLPITSAGVGSGNTAAADGDTALQTPVLTGISITNATVSDNVLQVDVFVADGTLADGTYKEFALYCGTQLFCRIIISPDYTKAAGEDTLFSYTLTLSG